jgi:hypothetical protein
VDFKITTQTTNSPRSVKITAGVTTQSSDGSVRNISDGTSNTISMGDGSVRSIASSLAATAILSITPTPPPFTIAVQPSQVTGGGQVAITLTVQQTAVATTSNSIALACDHPELLPLPASVPIGSGTTLSAGPQTSVVNATTNFAGADQSVTITATGFSSSAAATVLIRQTPPIASFTLRPTTVTGGLNVIAQLMLTNGAASPVTVNLTTDHPELISVPATVTVAPSQVPTPFTFHTSATTVRTTVRITASAGTQSIPVTVDVIP